MSEDGESALMTLIEFEKAAELEHKGELHELSETDKRRYMTTKTYLDRSMRRISATLNEHSEPIRLRTQDIINELQPELNDAIARLESAADMAVVKNFRAHPLSTELVRSPSTNTEVGAIPRPSPIQWPGAMPQQSPESRPVDEVAERYEALVERIADAAEKSAEIQQKQLATDLESSRQATRHWRLGFIVALASLLVTIGFKFTPAEVTDPPTNDVEQQQVDETVP